MAGVNAELAKKLTGRGAPRSFALDAESIESEQFEKIVREDVKQNAVRFEFPEGLAKIDIFEECRALNSLDDFDVMKDITMQMLEGKPVRILLEGKAFCEFQVTDRHMDLRGVDKLDEYPVLFNWLCEFVAGMLLKKYPVPSEESPPERARAKGKRGRIRAE